MSFVPMKSTTFDEVAFYINISIINKYILYINLHK